MNNFFFVDSNTALEKIESKKEVQFIPSCLDVDESRTFHQGKSFRFWDWETNKSRTFINDDFYQDLVKYGGSIWICINTTTSKPGTSGDWTKFISNGEKGDKGEKGEKGDSGNGNFEVGAVKPTSQGFVNDIYLDVYTGTFYKYSDSWKEIGKISVEDPEIDLSDYYTKSEVDAKIGSIDFPEFNLDWQDD